MPNIDRILIIRPHNAEFSSKQCSTETVIVQFPLPFYSTKVLISNHVRARCKCGKCLQISKCHINKMRHSGLKPYKHIICTQKLLLKF